MTRHSHFDKGDDMPTSAAAVASRASQRPTTYPTLFVCVPHSVAASYWHRPWPEVLVAAEEGRDGLTISDTRPHFWGGKLEDGAAQVPDVAFLAEGNDRFRGRTVLFQQNW
jgi:hypothetical protein